MTTRRSDSAFPIGYNRDTDSLIDGMTKREYFAIMIMQGYTTANTKFEDEYQKARLSVAEADVENFEKKIHIKLSEFSTEQFLILLLAHVYTC